MGFRALFLGVAVACAGFGGTAMACDTYIPIDTAQARQLMAVIEDPEADEFDQFAAFQTLSCSDQPVIRDYAMRNGLTNAKGDLVRGQMLFDILAQKERYKIVLTATSSLGKNEKDFISKNNGALFYNRNYIDKIEGCIGIYYDRCEKRFSIYFKGIVLILTYQDLIGELKLGDDNKVTGYIRNGSSNPDIQAELILTE